MEVEVQNKGCSIWMASPKAIHWEAHCGLLS